MKQLLQEPERGEGVKR